MYEELCNHQVDKSLFSLTSPAFKLVSNKLFPEVQKNYGTDVVKAVKEMAESHKNDCITLAQIMLSHLWGGFEITKRKLLWLWRHRRRVPCV